MLQGPLDGYVDVNKGCSHKVDAYVRYIKELVSIQLNKAMDLRVHELHISWPPRCRGLHRCTEAQGHHCKALGGFQSLAMPLGVINIQMLMPWKARRKWLEEKFEVEEKKKLALLILSIVFMAMPFAGEAIGAELGATMLASGRLVNLVGLAGDAALTFYEVAQDPVSAPFQVLAILLGAGGALMRKASEMDYLVRARQSLDTAVLAKLGKVFQKNDEKLQRLSQCAQFASDVAYVGITPNEMERRAGRQEVR
ncbi:hypothetical protein HIM_07881 [Hirsutella minnesotensis 3608]|uniref:Uncharacterized protein n=1 Tax=Hirsutella minnesotensis 3608 TaxID=1043627 RepID=A0A0F8A3Z5_9HYPO|nr:hypothetical protein HIM_07881 [Hirsutella minnesotensis 3608]